MGSGFKGQKVPIKTNPITHTCFISILLLIRGKNLNLNCLVYRGLFLANYCKSYKLGKSGKKIQLGLVANQETLILISILCFPLPVLAVPFVLSDKFLLRTGGTLQKSTGWDLWRDYLEGKI